MNGMNVGFNMPMNRQVKQDTSKFTPDDWIRYINPLVNLRIKRNYSRNKCTTFI